MGVSGGEARETGMYSFTLIFTFGRTGLSPISAYPLSA
jgi:hypothetical protein